jgi:acyl-homoserine-lactone acylase
VPGNRAAVAWKDYHSFEELPQQLNPAVGYLYNTNHSPFKAGALADTLSAAAHPQEMGFDLRDNNRSVRFRELMPEQGTISWQQFNQLKFDQTLPKDLAFRTNLQSLFTLNPDTYPELKAQINALVTWNKEADVKSEGAALFAFVYYYWWDEFTKSGRSIDTVISEKEAIQSLQAAKTHFQTHFGKELVALGEYQKLVRGDKVLPLWGIDDVLTTIRSTTWEKGMRKAAQGESYILMARFGKGLPVLESINVYGASNRPDSPHYADQMERFVARELKPMTLDKRSVLQNAKRVYHPGD